MKHAVKLLSFCWCIFFAGVPPVFAQTSFGPRIFYQNDFVKASDKVVQGPAAGELELGGFIRHSFTHYAAVRAEANFVRARYKLKDGEHYDALRFYAIPEWQTSRIFSIGVGVFVDMLLFDALKQQKNATSGMVANAAIRYGRVEIQCRFQRSFIANHKYGLGAGLAYHFGAEKTDAVKPPK